MSTTSIPSGSGLAPQRWSDALFAMASKEPTPINALMGPAPTISSAEKVLRKQTTTGMPIVMVRDLAQSAGDTVRVDCANIVKLRPVMGDENAEGKGAKLDFSYKDMKLDMATLPVSLGGKMTQKRFQHDLRRVALAQLAGSVPSFLWQRCLTLMAGARGAQDSIEWVLPLSTDPEFASMMVNAVKAPTYNRHYVVDGTDLIQGGAQLASIDTSDVLILDHIDALASLVEEQRIRMLPVRVPGDPAASDDPILGVLMLDNLVWDRLITDKTASANIRHWQSLASERAAIGNLQRHPLFAAGAFMWRNILVRKMGQFACRFESATAIPHITSANRYTATETNVTIGTITNYQVSRSLFLGSQALGVVEGANTTSGVPYSMLEHSTNYGRNVEIAGELMRAEEKLRFSLPDGLGNYEPTDIGVLVIDSVTKKRSS